MPNATKASAYGIPKHRHLSEIEQELSWPRRNVTIQFSLHLFPVTRGILTTQYLAPTGNFKTVEEEQSLAQRLTNCLAEAYAQNPSFDCCPMAFCGHQERYSNQLSRPRLATRPPHRPIDYDKRH